jgi:hypothetical protein
MRLLWQITIGDKANAVDCEGDFTIYNGALIYAHSELDEENTNEKGYFGTKS